MCDIPDPRSHVPPCQVNLVRVLLRVLALFTRAQAVVQGKAALVSFETMDSLSALSDTPIPLGGPLAAASARVWLARAVAGIVYFLRSLRTALTMDQIQCSLFGMAQHTADLGLALHLTQGPRLSPP